VLRFGELVIDSAARHVSLAGQRIELPKREYSLLEILLAGMNRAVSKSEIANKLFAFDDEAAPNAIEVYIARLRKKLEGSPLRIETQRGTGYLLTAVGDAGAAADRTGAADGGRSDAALPGAAKVSAPPSDSSRD
jgi:two-component system response regulator TctD